MIKIGDYVTRKSYNNDIVFQVIDIRDDTYILKGVNFRLVADSEEEDLVCCDNDCEDDEEYLSRVVNVNNLDRDEFFYLPGKVLHIDGDKMYLDRCMGFYKKSGIMAFGKNVKEDEVFRELPKYLREINPDILIITGHDAYLRKRIGNDKAYKNSDNFIKAVKEARKYEKSMDKLIIIAGACQSNYEELIKAGATFASSPKRINIHALDPAIIATSLCLSDRGKEIDLIELLEKTKYGKDGIGGLKSKGMMYIGYPRNEA